jgi:hypothetical protein
MVSRLRRLSHTQSLETGHEVTWCDLARLAIAAYLATVDAAKEPAASPGSADSGFVVDEDVDVSVEF